MDKYGSEIYSFTFKTVMDRVNVSHLQRLHDAAFASPQLNIILIQLIN